MNFLVKGAASDKRLQTLKSMALNPNAAEFVPFALRSPTEYTSTTDAASKFTTSASATLGKAVLDRSESSASNNSDDEAHQYWRRQLPDDITPDFKVMGEDDSHGITGVSLSGLSLNDVSETSRFPASVGSGFMVNGLQELSPHPSGNSFSEKIRYPVSYGKDLSASFQHLSPRQQIMNNDQLVTNAREEPQFNENLVHGLVPGMLTEQLYLDSADINPLEFLASQFPGFSAESLAEVYFASGGDLNLTIEMLTQLELQIDTDLNQNLSAKALSAPNLSALDFPALTAADRQNGMPNFCGDEIQQNVNSYRHSGKDMLLFKSSSSIPSIGDIDFASAVRKMAPQNSGIWKYDRNGSSDASVGSSRSSHALASSYSSGQGKGVYGDRSKPRRSNCAAPIWLETGEAVAHMYSDMREEARDHARLRNTYFEQARQAYLVGNKALAKELSVKGQLHNMQMKAAHGKAQESIYRQRNPISPEMQATRIGHERVIDLHGLHVSEAIHVLKHELAVLRNAARSADQRLQIYICVGTGHHTRGSRTPARLPTAVQKYLLDEEGLDFSEPQPGLLRVVIY